MPRCGVPSYAVLLRGVNVGGRGTLPMATLRSVLTDLGYDGVRTYLQSGNAVLRTPASATRVSSDIEKALASAAGRPIGVVVRTAAQMARVADGWPFAAKAPPNTKHVMFFAKAADAAALRSISLDAVAPERLVVAGANVYFHYPNGLGKSKLGPIVGRTPAGKRGTMRNWNTVTALRDMTAEL